MVDPATGPHRLRAASTPSGKAEKEKRKRSRVTPEQLVHLEQFFSVDRSPTAARRKEISDLLGMQERQTQIWFQNRRAKAKLQDGKKGQVSNSVVETPPDTPPELATAYEAELHNLLNEVEPITIIPCTELSVGCWRRIATTIRKHDLVAYLCDIKRCLTWFIHSSGCGFKMEIPFDIIIDTEFTNDAPGSGRASFILSQPPTFYLESYLPLDSGQSSQPVRCWKKCADWTEDQQATKNLRHNLSGSAVQLVHLLRHLNDHACGSDVHLQSLRYPQKDLTASEPQPPPVATLTEAGYLYQPQDGVHFCQPDEASLTHKRSFSSPLAGQQVPLHDKPVHLPVAPPPSVPELDLRLYPQFTRHTVVGASQSSYSETALPHHISHSSEHGSRRTFSSHGSHQRPYSAGSVYSLPCEDNGRRLSFPDNLQPPPSSAPTPYGTPSPPLLTTPFYPTGSGSSSCPVSPYDLAMPVFSGLPGMSNSQ